MRWANLALAITACFAATASAEPALTGLLPASGAAELVVPTLPDNLAKAADPKAALVKSLAKMKFQAIGETELQVSRKGKFLKIASESSQLGPAFKQGLAFALDDRSVESPVYGKSSGAQYSPMRDILKLPGFWVPGYTFHLKGGHIHVGRVQSEKGQCLMGVQLSDGSQMDFVYLKYKCG